MKTYPLRPVHTSSEASKDGPGKTNATVVRLKHPVRNAITIVIAITLLLGGYSVVTNENFGWETVGQYLFDPQILEGLVNTLYLTVIAMMIGLALGITLAVMRLSPTWLLQAISSAYIWFFRGTPVLVQLIFWYNFGALYSHLSLGIPFGPQMLSVPSNDFITPLTAAILGLGLNQAAYTAEVIRGGFLSVGKGQREAAKAIGMTPGLIYRRIVLPQAMPSIIPPVGNELISMLKGTSLVSVIAMTDLLHSAQLIYARTYETIPLLMVVCVWYLAITTVLILIQGRVERHYANR
ncbi:ABC transporter permease [Arthrobacter sp. StoSoilB5]|nr:ABC transporter permease [Arthrobacter sp. StoSoilB5]